MGKNLYIQDSAQAFLEDLKTGKLIAVGCASVAGLSVTTESQDIRGGLGY